MNHDQIAIDNFKRFASIEGNQYIATEYALRTILRLMEDFNVQSVLELGLGIGSISDTVFKYADAKGISVHYTGTEANDYCLSVLPANVEHYDRIRLYHDLSEVPTDKRYDLIIVDGSDESLKRITAYTKPDTIIFVEGWRGAQVGQIKSIFPKSRHAEIIANYRHPAYGPFPSNQWNGGGQLIFIDPSLSRKWYWFREKLSTAIKRRTRK